MSHDECGLDAVGFSRSRVVAKLTRQADAWVVPTMVLWETLRGTAELSALRALPELQYMPRRQIEEWTIAQENLLMSPTFKPDVARQIIQTRMRLLKVLSDEGVKIMLGSDAPQRFSVRGFSIHREMARMADAGMKPYDIIKSGSYNVGGYFKNQDDFGTIGTGQRADLILVEANPLENVANLARRAGVMVRG